MQKVETPVGQHDVFAFFFKFSRDGRYLGFLRERYFDAMHRFFALPLEEKNEIAIGKSEYHRGYVGFATETLEGALGGGQTLVPDQDRPILAPDEAW